MIDAANLKFFERKPCKISIVCLACFLLLGIPKAKPAWVQLGTSFADRVGEFGFTDTIVTGTLQRFYRGVSP